MRHKTQKPSPYTPRPSEIYRQHCLKQFPYRQGINNFVSVSVQLHWHLPFKKTPLTWDICTNMRTCSIKRPCIDRIFNVQVVIRVQPTPQRGTGVGKERGSHEGENLRDRVRGCKSLTLVPLVVSRVNSSNVIKWNSEPEKFYSTNSTIGSLLS